MDDDSAWILLAETRTVRVYGLRRPASLRVVLNDRERTAGKPLTRNKGQK